MAIAYYANKAETKHWDALWKANELAHLLAVAERDPLSEHLGRHLPTTGTLILEGGCGLGQYIPYFKERGYNIIGGDFSLSALQTHRQIYSASPLLGLDLRQLPFADNSLAGHISIGVIEHSEEGPQKLLNEIYRTLSVGSIALISVPWENGARRFFGSLIRRQQAQKQADGAVFYQYAYSQQELHGFLIEAGFTVQIFYPYSPAKGTREILHLLKFRKSSRASSVWVRPDSGADIDLARPLRFSKPARSEIDGFAPKSEHTPSVSASGSSRVQIKEHPLRRLLYTPPFLNSFAHMILAVAIKK